ncbi:Nucleic acid-binding, OB-fold [Sesbania bispinosa]|nr:Nucleic acid-binding, OB-fold [Sesbania bispinosa]
MALVPGGIHFIKALCDRRENWRLMVKLVRCWNMCSVATPNESYALQMLFVDEEVFLIQESFIGSGDRIEATVQKPLMNKFRYALFEGEVYKLTLFGLMRNCGKFRATSHEFKIMFNETTKLIPCQNPKIRSLGLALLKTSDIAQTNGRSDYLLNFMGIPNSCVGGIASEQGGTSDTTNVQCAIFGDLVDVVCCFISGSPSGLPIVVIQLARVNFYKGHVGIQNLMNASKIYWNPEWPIAVEFKNSLAVHEVETDVCIGTISDRGRPVCLKEEFLKLYPKKSVGQLVETVEKGSFVVLGTITKIIEDTSWWYMACTCMKAISYDPGFPYYDDCKTLLFELTAGTSLRELVLISQSKGLSCGEFPTEIQELVGKEFLFRVENKDELLYGLDDSFKINDQLKFAPPFTKMANIEGDTCRVDLTTDINVAASVLDVSLISIGQSSSTGCQSSSSAHEGGEGNNRELDNSVNASSDRLKRQKRKVLKTEKP